MADRLINILENGRTIQRGLSHRRAGPLIEMRDGERLTVTFDWSGWLGSTTISLVSNSPQGVSLSSEANSDTQASFDVQATASGWVEQTITASDGQKKQIVLLVRHDEPANMHDYGFGLT